LGVSAVDPRTSITVQIFCFDDQDSPPTCVETLSDLKSWLDLWLDRSAFNGSVIITFAE
jgi:hypothetical protein